MQRKVVHSASELIAATKDMAVRKIEVGSSIDGLPPVRLSPGQTLVGLAGAAYILEFTAGSDGLQLTSDNRVQSLHLVVSPDKRALFNDTSVATWGLLSLHNVQVVGQVQLLARDQVRAGHVEVADLHISLADTSAAGDRPLGYGVSVLQGAFTLWNMQPDKDVMITADLRAISAGRAGAPVLGSGVFVSGAADTGGQLLVQKLETGEIFSNGMIAQGTPDLISGGVFVVYGCRAKVVRNHGPVTTYGANDMALDNWGFVDRWVSTEAITTHGASGIGFVNFGVLEHLEVKAPIETFGQGARGFNVYTGTVKSAEFDRIVTHGDGAVGVQIAQPVGELVFHRGIETFGAIGPSLVKGVVQQLSAIALSLKEGGSAERISIRGGLKTNRKGVLPLEQLGSLGSFSVEGGFGAQIERAAAGKQ